MSTVIVGIAFALFSIVCFCVAHRDAVISANRPHASAFIERNGARAYFMDENINDLWKFVEKGDDVKLSTTWVGKK